jgi:hypothetical protein
MMATGRPGEAVQFNNVQLGIKRQVKEKDRSEMYATTMLIYSVINAVTIIDS